jgi:RimJ/RimL family protein N-acetyltransferase
VRRPRNPIAKRRASKPRRTCDQVPVRMRELGPEDRKHVETGCDQLSDAAIRARFLAVVKPTPRLFAWVDRLEGDDTSAVGVSHAESGTPIGLARLVRDVDDPSHAEIAITIVDKWQRRGIGTALIAELARRAAAVGITTFSATMLAENRAARALGATLGDLCFGPSSNGVTQVDVRIADGPAAQTAAAHPF